MPSNLDNIVGKIKCASIYIRFDLVLYNVVYTKYFSKSSLNKHEFTRCLIIWIIYVYILNFPWKYVLSDFSVWFSLVFFE